MWFYLIVLIVYLNYDLNWIIRVGISFVYNYLFNRKKQNILEPVNFMGICLPQDCDSLLTHMNNSRYLRELDIARFYYFQEVGLKSEMLKAGGGFVMQSTIRYRRNIKLFQLFKIETKLIWWDEKSLYLEQKFITPSDGFVRAVGIIKKFLGNRNHIEMLQKFPECTIRPEIPEQLKLWIESNDISSQQIKKETSDKSS